MYLCIVENVLSTYYNKQENSVADVLSNVDNILSTQQATLHHRDATDRKERGVLSFSKREQKNKVVTISRVHFRRFAKDKAFKRAFAFCLCVKSYIPCSVARNFTYKQLSQLAGISIRSCKKRVKEALENGLIEFFGEKGRHVRFKRLKMRGNNIRMDKKFDISSYESTITALNATIVLDVQQSKSFLLQQCLTLEDRNAELKEIKSARKRLERYGAGSREEYADNGCSQDMMCKRYGISKRDIQRAFSYAEKLKVYHRQHRYAVLATFKYKQQANSTLKSLKNNEGEAFVADYYNTQAGKATKNLNRRAKKVFSDGKEKIKRSFVAWDKESQRWCIAFQTTCKYTKRKKQNEWLFGNEVSIEEYTPYREHESEKMLCD